MTSNSQILFAVMSGKRRTGNRRQKTRFNANPALGTEPCKWQASPLVLRSPPPSTEPKTPKVSKSLPRGVWDPLTPDPKKVRKKFEKSREWLIFRLFRDFSDFFLNISGSGVGGSQTPLLGLFWDFLGFRVFGSVDGVGDLNLSLHGPNDLGPHATKWGL